MQPDQVIGWSNTSVERSSLLLDTLTSLLPLRTRTVGDAPVIKTHLQHNKAVHNTSLEDADIQAIGTMTGALDYRKTYQQLWTCAPAMPLEWLLHLP